MFTCSTPWITPQQSDPPVRYNAVFLEVGGRLARPRFLRESLPQFGSEKCQNGRRPSKENDQASHLPICGSSRVPDSMRCLERCLATDVKDLYYIWEIANRPERYDHIEWDQAKCLAALKRIAQFSESLANDLIDPDKLLEMAEHAGLAETIHLKTSTKSSPPIARRSDPLMRRPAPDGPFLQDWQRADELASQILANVIADDLFLAVLDH
jgi:hypothetical protein